MRHTRLAAQALRLAAEPSRSPFVCRACLAHASRHFSSSSPTSAEARNEPFWKRMNETIFGTKEKKQADQSREEKTKRRIEEAAKRTPGDLETKTDRHGQVYEIADVVDPSIIDSYMPATTWDGLETVGSEQWVKERADQGEQYFGFMPKKRKHLSSTQWEMLLHHIAVEALALQMAGRDLEQICNARLESVAANATITSHDGQSTVQFADEQTKSTVLQAIAENGQLAVGEESRVDPVGATNVEFDPAYSRNWMQMSLRDPELKLAIIKRVAQVTGKRIPDIAISNANTITDLFNSLQKKEAPRKLARTNEARRVGQLPNVQIHSTRRTPVHREKQIGRWKIIEDELTLRDLPVFGSRYVDAKEGKILQRAT